MVAFCFPSSHRQKISHLGLQKEGQPLDKLETAAVKRFTITYDKLCKSCPTRIEPRIETLEEMIMGLPIEDREQLLTNVARRVQEGTTSQVRTPRDVYDFQVPDDQKPPDAAETTTTKDTEKLPKIKKVEIVPKVKILNKMDKTRDKFEENKRKVAYFEHLLDATTLLLSKETLQIEDSNPTDSALYHELDELLRMDRGELKFQRLKYAAQKAKFEQKLAKGRMKLYGTSMKLAEAQS